MSRIPYIFETPIPSFFRKDGWFKNEKTWKFVSWAFSRCSSIPRDVVHDNKNIHLEPFMFIFGRDICAEECLLTPDEVRTQQKSMQNAGFIKKCPNKTPKRYTLYIWVVEAFPGSNPQQIPRSTPNSPPTNPHNLEEQNKEKQQLPDVVEFFEKINKTSQSFILKRYPTEIIQKAIVYLSNPEFKLNTSWEQAIKWACKDEPWQKYFAPPAQDLLDEIEILNPKLIKAHPRFAITRSPDSIEYPVKVENNELHKHKVSIKEMNGKDQISLMRRRIKAFIQMLQYVEIKKIKHN